MFKFTVKVNQRLLERLRELPERAQRNLRNKMQTQLKGDLQAQVDELMGERPGEIDSPFTFGTDKSRAKYFVIIRENPDLTDGAHWIWTGELASGFKVEISDRLRENLIRIVNQKQKAPFVYGPWAVAGHINTGYLQQVSLAKQQLRQYAIRTIIRYWRESVREGLRG